MKRKAPKPRPKRRRDRLPRDVKFAAVLWLDAYYSEDEDKEPGEMQISAGVLMRNDSKCVKLALIRDADMAGVDDPYRDTLTIPRGMVRCVRILRS